MKILPGLLIPCALYMVHARAYWVSSGEEISALLRADARRAIIGQIASANLGDRPDHLRYESEIRAITDAACDELTLAHIASINTYARAGASAVEIVATAHAILSGTPGMLAWWCEQLSE